MTGDNKPNAAAMTMEQAVKLVTRQVPKKDKNGKPELGEDKKPVLESQPVPVADVLGWKEYDDHVIVVTRAGEKLRGEKKK